jgi:hypothetical protein
MAAIPTAGSHREGSRTAESRRSKKGPTPRHVVSIPALARDSALRPPRAAPVDTPATRRRVIRSDVDGLGAGRRSANGSSSCITSRAPRPAPLQPNCAGRGAGRQMCLVTRSRVAITSPPVSTCVARPSAADVSKRAIVRAPRTAYASVERLAMVDPSPATVQCTCHNTSIVTATDGGRQTGLIADHFE